MSLLLLLLMASLLRLEVRAGEVEWTTSGPAVRYGVNAIAIDPQNPRVIYAAGRTDGLFKSVDGGNSWESIWVPPYEAVNGNLVLVDPVVEHLVIDPHHPGAVYIEAAQEGILKSADGGKTWGKITQALPGNAGVPSILDIDPLHPGVIYAGNTGSEVGLFRSTDGGITWVKVLPEPVSAVIRPEQNPQVLYASSRTALFKSFDGGINWALVSSGMPLFVIAVDSRDSGIIYTGGKDPSGGAPVGVVFKSMDSGATWTRVFEMADAWIWSLAVDPNDPEIVYAGSAGKVHNPGLFRSTNGGKAWTKVNTSPPMTIAIDPQNTSTIYVGMMSGGVVRFTFSDPPTAVEQTSWGEIKKNH